MLGCLTSIVGSCELRPYCTGTLPIVHLARARSAQLGMDGAGCSARGWIYRRRRRCGGAGRDGAWLAAPNGRDSLSPIFDVVGGVPAARRSTPRRRLLRVVWAEGRASTPAPQRSAIHFGFATCGVRHSRSMV